MIVLDEEIYDPQLARQISAWYVGRVVSIRALRPNTIIKDNAIPALLRAASRPTFVTINTSDFWRIFQVDSHYSIICVDLPATQVLEISNWLRQLFAMTQFKTKSARACVQAGSSTIAAISACTI